eukprot:10860063-Heterocapsa_arctica.AAC.1
MDSAMAPSWSVTITAGASKSWNHFVVTASMIVFSSRSLISTATLNRMHSQIRCITIRNS